MNFIWKFGIFTWPVLPCSLTGVVNCYVRYYKRSVKNIVLLLWYRHAVPCNSSNTFNVCSRKAQPLARSWQLCLPVTSTLSLPRLKRKCPSLRGKTFREISRLQCCMILVARYAWIYSLDLDAWINDPPSSSSEDEVERVNIFGGVQTTKWVSRDVFTVL